MSEPWDGDLLKPADEPPLEPGSRTGQTRLWIIAALLAAAAIVAAYLVFRGGFETGADGHGRNALTHQGPTACSAARRRRHVDHGSSSR